MESDLPSLTAVLGTSAVDLGLAWTTECVMVRGWACGRTGAWPRAMRDRHARGLVAASGWTAVALAFDLWRRSAEAADVPLTAAGHAVVTMLVATHYGHAWMYGSAAVIVLALGARAPSIVPVVALAVLCYTRSIVSHAGGAGDLSLAVAVDVVHLLAVSLGVAVVAEGDAGALAQLAVRHAADLVVAASACPSSRLFEAARMLATLAPCPFVLFTSDGDPRKIELASSSGVHAYVVDGYGRHRLLSVIQVAHHRFLHEQRMKDELTGLSQRFEERKLVDRAKGTLMRSRGITEDAAFEMLRSLAMRARQRIGVVARSVIDRSRAAEAVNRGGQLRMLSQRIVLCYAQMLNGVETGRAAPIVADCVERVETNLGILRRAVATATYAELVDRVAASWRDVRAICGEAPDAARLTLLDARAERMLEDAETLTEFLEASGLVASLHVINVAGRQRMLGQRIAKLCFMLALDPSPAILDRLRALKPTFQSALAYLEGVPLSSPSIRADLDAALGEWRSLQEALAVIDDTAALGRISDASERLLDASERLTDQYERAMQMLIGDRLERLR